MPFTPQVGSADITDELVVCTRDRPDELARCLGSIALQTRIPSTVRVVDGSDGPETGEAVKAALQGPIGARLAYQRSTPGLTIQRNAGIRAGRSDVVHFIDDDVVLEAGYIEAIMSVFDTDRRHNLLGVGGLVTNVHHRRPTWTKQHFGLYGNRPGSVMSSGRNILAVDVKSDVEVDWLSGCSMSFRREVFNEHEFDEELPGYGLGEDLDFSYRVRQTGRLLVTPAARLAHLQSPANRLTSSRYTADELTTRARRVRQRTGCLRMRAYWWSVIGQLAGLLLASVVGSKRRSSRDRLMTTVRTAFAIACEGLTNCPRLVPTTLPSVSHPPSSGARNLPV